MGRSDELSFKSLNGRQIVAHSSLASNEATRTVTPGQSPGRKRGQLGTELDRDSVAGLLSAGRMRQIARLSAPRVGPAVMEPEAAGPAVGDRT
jgi:hypothetical protein